MKPSWKDEIAAKARKLLEVRAAERKKPERRAPASIAAVLPVKHRAMPSGLQQQYGLAALTKEAHRRGTTYGKLVSRLSVEEQDEIVRAYAEEKQQRRRK